MNKITVEAPAKINLTLDIIRRLPSGYHEIESVKQSIQLKDKIIIKESENMKISCNIPGVPLNNENLVWKAVDLLKNRSDIKENVEIIINKNIPVGTGLGGGSSNAAATINALNKLWNLGLGEEELTNLASEVGCDCCFCIVGGTCVASGIGDKIKKIKKIPKLNIVVATSCFAIYSKDAYSSLNYKKIGKAKKTKAMIEAIESKDIQRIAENLHNDFEFTILEKYPIIKEIKKIMLENGALGSLMSGSGSAVFGLAENRKEANLIYENLKEKFNFVKITSTC